MALGLLLAGGAGAQQPAGDPGAGQARYLAVGCYECHGTVGQGGSGMRISPLPLPWVGFELYVRRPAGQMPAFSDKVLSAASLADIYAFLQSLPSGRKASEIGLLQELGSQ
jgi:ubiquinol-cytochrome c reductase cytochrome c subunit